MSWMQDQRESPSMVVEDGTAIQVQIRNSQNGQYLFLHLEGPDGRPVLTDPAGTLFHPWEVELLRWPLTAEVGLRRGSYLPRLPDPTELWCNCVD